MGSPPGQVQGPGWAGGAPGAARTPGPAETRPCSEKEDLLEMEMERRSLRFFAQQRGSEELLGAAVLPGRSGHPQLVGVWNWAAAVRSSRRSRRAMGLWGHAGGGLEPPSFPPASWRKGGAPWQGSESPDTSGSESGKEKREGGREGGWVGDEDAAAEDEDEEMRYKTVINHPAVPSHRRLHTPTQPGSSGHHSRSVKSDLLRSF